MTPKDFIEYDISVLLLRYGKSAVLRALSHKINMSHEGLISELERARVAQEVSFLKKKRVEAKFNLDAVLAGHEGKDLFLRKLLERFENRTFLPELKDVKRFFERYGGSSVQLKSRASSQLKLFRLLASLKVEDLEKILTDPPVRSKFSSLGLISDEILGRTNQISTKE
ncbi:hypothetical protein K5D43_15490 [Pseudomonas cichorii]|nr:hypothetical protein [Pseudomonas cichorii]MBX8555889.1 hypothetical protein [Pseudomonas cichorii]